MASPLTRFCVAISIFVLAVQAEQMLAIAPVTTLARREDSGKRPQFGHCPAATQTLCPDHVGCCPNGAACTQSRGIPVCDESCKGGPSCPQGGCCQVGYVCGTTNNFCTPAPTAHSQHAIEAPVTTTGSGPVVTLEHDPVSTAAELLAESAVESAPNTITTASTTTTTPIQASHELPHETDSTGSTTIKASTPIVQASSSHLAGDATAISTTATAHDGSKFVGTVSGAETKGATPSATSSSEATFVSISSTNGFLVGIVLGTCLVVL